MVCTHHASTTFGIEIYSYVLAFLIILFRSRKWQIFYMKTFCTANIIFVHIWCEWKYYCIKTFSANKNTVSSQNKLPPISAVDMAQTGEGTYILIYMYMYAIHLKYKPPSPPADGFAVVNNPGNFAMVRFYFKAIFAVRFCGWRLFGQIIWWLFKDGGISRCNEISRTYSNLIISCNLCKHFV